VLFIHTLILHDQITYVRSKNNKNYSRFTFKSNFHLKGKTNLYIAKQNKNFFFLKKLSVIKMNDFLICSWWHLIYVKHISSLKITYFSFKDIKTNDRILLWFCCWFIQQKKKKTMLGEEEKVETKFYFQYIT